MRSPSLGKVFEVLEMMSEALFGWMEVDLDLDWYAVSQVS